ncbi:MAG TPA: selenocysteine-specific translation elongation factor, partial [Candidatus Sumerlaeota bacterium]|nr:selenocysteine-specific translation elongation factor [Candidatus Sumerlaeota bacterium]
MTETMGHRAPGLVTNRMNPDLVMMVCTAGHVDHGKTALVKMLTGCMTDRLREEQERGLTIDLGFAPCLLGGNLSVGIVDVPGHEKFIRNMVAGVSGIGMTILVIAADDGVMPQTVEHMQIMTLLGVRRGIIALTKTDLVDSKTREIRIAEIREFVKNTFLKDAPICPVSSKTFEGYDSFYTRFVEEVSHIRREQALGLFRMPVERVFMRQGFGMVLTGIPVAGVVRVGDELELMPGGNRGRVRAIQRFSREAEEGFAGQCLALNLPDMGRMEPRRGQVLCTPGCIEPACIVHTYLTIVPGLHLPLKNAVEIKFHSGTLELHGKIYMLEKSEIASGESGFATIVLAEPAAIAPGDRLIIRRPSPAETVAGGEILVLTRGDRRPSRQIILPRLERRLSMTGRFDPASREGLAGLFEYLLLDEFPQGSSGEALARSALLHMEEARDILDTLLQTGVVRKISAGWVIHR